MASTTTPADNPAGPSTSQPAVAGTTASSNDPAPHSWNATKSKPTSREFKCCRCHASLLSEFGRYYCPRCFHTGCDHCNSSLPNGSSWCRKSDLAPLQGLYRCCLCKRDLDNKFNYFHCPACFHTGCDECGIDFPNSLFFCVERQLLLRMGQECDHKKCHRIWAAKLKDSRARQMLMEMSTANEKGPVRNQEDNRLRQTLMGGSAADEKGPVQPEKTNRLIQMLEESAAVGERLYQAQEADRIRQTLMEGSTADEGPVQPQEASRLRRTLLEGSTADEDGPLQTMEYEELYEILMRGPKRVTPGAEGRSSSEE